MAQQLPIRVATCTIAVAQDVPSTCPQNSSESAALHLAQPLLPTSCSIHHGIFLDQNIQGDDTGVRGGPCTSVDAVKEVDDSDWIFLAKPFDKYTCSVHFAAGIRRHELDTGPTSTDEASSAGAGEVLHNTLEQHSSIGASAEHSHTASDEQSVEELRGSCQHNQLPVGSGPMMADVSPLVSPVWTWLKGVRSLDPFHLLNIDSSNDMLEGQKRLTQELSEVKCNSTDAAERSQEGEVRSNEPKSSSETCLTKRAFTVIEPRNWA